MAADEIPRPARALPRWLAHVAVLLGIVALAGVSLFAHFFVFMIASQTCSVGFDTSTEPPPAPASPQGQLGGIEASPWGVTIWCVGFLASAILTVVLILVAWRRWSWHAGLPALALLVVVPGFTNWTLNLPPDDCSPAVKAAHPRHCGRGG